MIYSFTFEELTALDTALGKLTVECTEYPYSDSIRIEESNTVVNVQLRYIPSGCIAAASCASGILIAHAGTAALALRELKRMVFSELDRRATAELES